MGFPSYLPRNEYHVPNGLIPRASMLPKYSILEYFQEMVSSPPGIGWCWNKQFEFSRNVHLQDDVKGSTYVAFHGSGPMA